MGVQTVEQRIERLKSELVQMANLARDCFHKAIENLESRDETIARRSQEIDHQIDELELRIDELCIELLTSGPYAADLRLVYMASKTVKDVERIGDESCALARWALRLSAPVDQEMQALSRCAGEALDKAIEALESNDISLAHEVLKIEVEIDRLEDGIMNASNDVARVLIARALERVGDLSTNICEGVIYNVQAKDVRHGHY